MSAPHTETKHTFCRICEALCGLEVTVENGERVAAIRPDDAHVATRGFACAFRRAGVDGGREGWSGHRKS